MEKNQPKPWQNIRNQIFLGSDNFVDEMQRTISPETNLSEIPAPQKRQAARPLDYYHKNYPDRNRAIINAYESGGYIMKEVGDYVNVHYSRISRIVRAKGKA